MGKTIRGFSGQPSEPDYPLPADLPFSVAPTQDNGARALAERLTEVAPPVRVPPRTAAFDPARLAAAILANGAVFVEDGSALLVATSDEWNRLRRIEAAARAYIMADDRDMDAVAERERELAATLAPEGSAGTACRCGTNVRQGIRHYWCLTHDAEWLLSDMACAHAAEGSARDGG